MEVLIVARLPSVSVRLPRKKRSAVTIRLRDLIIVKSSVVLIEYSADLVSLFCRTVIGWSAR